MLIKGYAELSSNNRPSVVSIGNYDGVHLGHQYVVESLLQKSTELNVPSTVITFDPLAKEFFKPNSVLRLSSVEQRAALLMDLGVDQVLCIDFNQEFANYSPLAFVEDVLIDGLGVQYLCIGDDFRFGKDRVGDFKFLKKLGRQRGFNVATHDTFELNGDRVSSGRVRMALESDNLELAQQLLGRPYSIQGEVSRGQQLGRTINFPTANINLEDYILPVNGVYAVRCQLNNDKTLIDGVANIGMRPTVSGKKNRLEVYLFDFDDDIYGESLDVQLLFKIRNEQKFSSVANLQKQIQLDVLSAKKYLQKT
ncbi:UNVERIFIED_CONTAM: hypothetical protein GTU68_013891 [Idotea baltica]|nr:hypothetical protein [Idotea baltica]